MQLCSPPTVTFNVNANTRASGQSMMVRYTGADACCLVCGTRNRSTLERYDYLSTNRLSVLLHRVFTLFVVLTMFPVVVPYLTVPPPVL